MRITAVRLRNVKSFYNEERWDDVRDDLNILIGPNAGGKSNILEIVQGVFNSVLFTKAVIEKGQRGVPYSLRLEPPALHANPHLVDELFDYPAGVDSKDQSVSITCKIDTGDVATLNTLRSNIDALRQFESDQTNTMHITDELRRCIEVIGAPDDLLGASFDINIIDQQLCGPSNQGHVRVDGFFMYLKLTNALTSLINNLYNFESETPIAFRPCFTYLPAVRVPIGMGNLDTTLSLASINDLSQASYSQYGMTTDSIFSHIDALKHRLVMNVHSGLPFKNQPFIDQLKEIDLKVSITKVRTWDSEYRIKFERLSGVSPKLSAGEKEFFNLLSLFFVQDLADGVVIIDEPEMHLHPRWQKKFLKLITRLAERQNTQFILVTHSAHLVDMSTIKSITRVYKDSNGHSHIVKPLPSDLDAQPEKDAFQIVNTLNNEKVYFADKVVLVEGPEDRIIFEAALHVLQRSDDARAIEVVEVGGKAQFKKFKQHLDNFQINNVIICDLDYVSEVGTSEIRSLLSTSQKKMISKIKGKSSLDGVAISQSLEAIFSNDKTTYSKEELEPVIQLWGYLKTRSLSIRASLNSEEKDRLTSFISAERENGIFILSTGSIETIFNDVGHYDIGIAIKKAKDMRTADDIPAELAMIIMRILE